MGIIDDCIGDVRACRTSVHKTRVCCKLSQTESNIGRAKIERPIAHHIDRRDARELNEIELKERNEP